MDFDPVEFIMEVEETFSIRIKDEDLEPIHTLGMLYGLVLDKLSDQPPVGRCLSVQLFHRVRECLCDRFDIPREAVVLEASLEELLPADDRFASKERFFQGLADLHLPTLEPRPWIRGCVMLLVLLGVAGCVAGALMAVRRNQFATGASTATIGALVVALAVGVWNHMADRLPEGLSTVRSFVRYLMIANAAELVDREGRLVDCEVWSVLQAIFASHSGIPIGRLNPEFDLMNESR